VVFFYSSIANATGIGLPNGLDGTGVLILVFQYLVIPIIILFFLVKYLIPEFSKSKDEIHSNTITKIIRRRAILSWLLPVCALTVQMISELAFYGLPLFSLPFYISLIIYVVGVYYFFRVSVYFFSKTKEGLYSHYCIALVIHSYLLLSYSSLVFLF